MRIDIIVKTRVFNFKDIGENEAIILRTLLNLSEKGVKDKLNDDPGYWNTNLNEKDAILIGTKLCKNIMDAIDEV